MDLVDLPALQKNTTKQILHSLMTTGLFSHRTGREGGGEEEVHYSRVGSETNQNKGKAIYK